MTQAVTTDGAERLRTLYAVMAGVPSTKVDMNNWRKTFSEDATLLHDCGTAACAVGWACAYPEFQSQGLKWTGSAPLLKADGVARYNWEAVTEFFGVDQDTAIHLFQTRDSGLEAKKGVLKRIRTLLWKSGVIADVRFLELKVFEDGLTE